MFDFCCTTSPKANSFTYETWRKLPKEHQEENKSPYVPHESHKTSNYTDKKANSEFFVNNVPIESM